MTEIGKDNYTSFTMNKKSTQKLPATKEDFKKLEEQVRIVKVNLKEVDTKITVTKGRLLMGMDNLEEKLDDKMTLLRDDILTMKDEIVGEVKAMREEFTTHQGVHDRQQETLDNHEERIISLEQF